MGRWRSTDAGPDSTMTVSRYNGDTREAQITILLHELGHIVGLLPEDDDSWNTRSMRNTAEVSRHCKAETIAAAQNSSKHRELR
jgi:predicted Zn-dependent protease